VSFASHFSCTLQVNTVATVLLGLVVLFTILAVKSLLFTNGKGSVSEMNRACSYFELQSRVVSMGFAEFKAKTKSSLLISYSTLSQIENCYQHLRSILQTLPCCFSRLTAVLNFNITCCHRLISLGPQPAACPGSVCCPCCSLMKVKERIQLFLGNKTLTIQTRTTETRSPLHHMNCHLRGAHVRGKKNYYCACTLTPDAETFLQH